MLKVAGEDRKVQALCVADPEVLRYRTKVWGGGGESQLVTLKFGTTEVSPEKLFEDACGESPFLAGTVLFLQYY